MCFPKVSLTLSSHTSEVRLPILQTRIRKRNRGVPTPQLPFPSMALTRASTLEAEEGRRCSSTGRCTCDVGSPTLPRFCGLGVRALAREADLARSDIGLGPAVSGGIGSGGWDGWGVAIARPSAGCAAVSPG